MSFLDKYLLTVFYVLHVILMANMNMKTHAEKIERLHIISIIQIIHIIFLVKWFMKMLCFPVCSDFLVVSMLFWN